MDHGDRGVLCSVLFIEAALTGDVIDLVDLEVEALSVLGPFVAIDDGPTVNVAGFIRVCRLQVVKLLMRIKYKLFRVRGHFARAHRIGVFQIPFLEIHIGFEGNRGTIGNTHSRDFTF